MNSHTTFVLSSLDVYNWGPFGGRHTADIHPEGTAIIGPTGSGKTTLIDALMTLIAAQPKYNLASTGGHESDRDLGSYIRGVSGAGNSTNSNQHILRTGKTVTGISATFLRGKKAVTIGAIFWFDGQSSAAGDRKNLWLFSERDDQSLDDWLTLHHTSGARALKAQSRETTKFSVFSTKKSYLAQIRRFFEVGENAFNLLNRAAGLKQLNSIDEIFRELVLDDNSCFVRAAEVASEFDDLAAIREELEVARRQQQSLIPVELTYKKYQEANIVAARYKTLLGIIPTWFALEGVRLWGEKSQNLDIEIDRVNKSKITETHKLKELKGLLDTMQISYLKLGGNEIDQLKEQIHKQAELVEEKRRHTHDYSKLTNALGRDGAPTPEKLAQNRQWAIAEKAALRNSVSALKNETYDLGALRVQKQNEQCELQNEIDKISSLPNSNIPSQFQEFRNELASALEIDARDLPFSAELVEVKADQKSWRGAIERALGSNRLRVLVPERYIHPALEWVNNRDNRLHVRLLEAKTPNGSSRFFSDGFTRKLNYRTHPLRECLKEFLSNRDRHCVENVNTLKMTPFSMTIQGLMSNAAGQFDKQDQRPLHTGWMTGFDNKDRLSSLQSNNSDLKKDLDNRNHAFEISKHKTQDMESRQSLVQRLTEIEFDDINFVGVERYLRQLTERLRDLTNPSSELDTATRKLEKAKQAVHKVEEIISTIVGNLARLESDREHAERGLNKSDKRAKSGLSTSEQAIADEHLKLTDDQKPDELDELERERKTEIDRSFSEQSEKCSNLEKILIRKMAEAQKVDTGALSETGTELHDVQLYIDQLVKLTEEALPEKRDRFMAYLNRSSDQGVTQLLADIDNEVSIVEERIDDLNRTLKRVRFQSNKYLQLDPKRVVHESLRSLEKAQRSLRSAELTDDEGESHYRALDHIVKLLREASENKRTVGAKALLDPRFRLQFFISSIDRVSSEIIETRSGSQGGSGGEKEVMASYILTASLSYALCPQGADTPLFGTIVLDEAFSKSSQGVAGGIINALKEFGLHPLFVTPNKEMRLLRTHTRSAVLVNRRDSQATLTMFSWEELEAEAKKRTTPPNEDT